MGRRRKKLPTEAFPAKIESLSHEGRGIAHINKKTTFIHGALPNEEILFKYTGQRSKFDEGYVTEIVSASNDRVDAFCQHFDICGGCSLQHMDSTAQISHKQSVLIEQLQHIGEISAEEILSPLRSPEWGYRRKARLGVKYVEKKGRVLIGFREVNSSFIADISQCEVLHPAVGLKLTELQTLVADLSIYNKIPQIEVAIGDNNVVLILRHLSDLSEQDKQKLKQFEQQHNLEFFLQSGGPDSIVKLSTEQNIGLSYNLPNHDINIQFSASDFTQVNMDINRAMIDRVISMLELSQEDIVLDLFCGLGNFTLPIARYCKKITGVEGDHALIERAKANAMFNNIQNAEFVAMDLAQEALEAEFIQKPFNKLLLDPTRSGADKILQRLPLDKVDIIVYVSCNPATLARDSKILVHEKDFRLIKTGVMDMFPHTAHVESIALFKK